MQLPKYKKKKRIKLKVCQEPGCGQEFWGHPIAKYCDKHRNIKQRSKITNQPDSEERNITFTHNFILSKELTFTCCLDHCNQIFKIKALPKQFVYPRFCEEHRNEFKRKNFLRRKRLEQLNSQ